MGVLCRYRIRHVIPKRNKPEQLGKSRGGGVTGKGKKRKGGTNQQGKGVLSTTQGRPPRRKKKTTLIKKTKHLDWSEGLGDEIGQFCGMSKITEALFGEKPG